MLVEQLGVFVAVLLIFFFFNKHLCKFNSLAPKQLSLPIYRGPSCSECVVALTQCSLPIVASRCVLRHVKKERFLCVHTL